MISGYCYWYKIGDEHDYNSRFIELEISKDELKNIELEDIDIYIQGLDDKYLVIRAGVDGELSKEAKVYDS